LKVFRYLYILAVFVGPYLTVSAVWTIADIFNGLMAIPNMIAIFALSGVVVKETKDFFAAKKDIEIRRRKYTIYDLIYRKQKRIF
jgi:AGCS family alanine or glycine:cation symporter